MTLRCCLAVLFMSLLLATQWPGTHCLVYESARWSHLDLKDSQSSFPLGGCSFPLGGCSICVAGFLLQLRKSEPAARQVLAKNRR